jgi:hypothetical protein
MKSLTLGLVLILPLLAGCESEPARPREDRWGKSRQQEIDAEERQAAQRQKERDRAAAAEARRAAEEAPAEPAPAVVIRGSAAPVQSATPPARDRAHEARIAALEAQAKASETDPREAPAVAGEAPADPAAPTTEAAKSDAASARTRPAPRPPVAATSDFTQLYDRWLTIIEDRTQTDPAKQERLQALADEINGKRTSFTLVMTNVRLMAGTRFDTVLDGRIDTFDGRAASLLFRTLEVRQRLQRLNKGDAVQVEAEMRLDPRSTAGPSLQNATLY